MQKENVVMHLYSVWLYEAIVDSNNITLVRQVFGEDGD